MERGIKKKKKRGRAGRRHRFGGEVKEYKGQAQGNKNTLKPGGMASP